jgi:hypothetical protein
MILSPRGTRPFGPVSFDQPRGCSPGKGCVAADAKTWGASMPPHYLPTFQSADTALTFWSTARFRAWMQSISVCRIQLLDSSLNPFDWFNSNMPSCGHTKHCCANVILLLCLLRNFNFQLTSDSHTFVSPLLREPARNSKCVSHYEQNFCNSAYGVNVILSLSASKKRGFQTRVCSQYGGMCPAVSIFLH